MVVSSLVLIVLALGALCGVVLVSVRGNALRSAVLLLGQAVD